MDLNGKVRLVKVIVVLMSAAAFCAVMGVVFHERPLALAPAPGAQSLPSDGVQQGSGRRGF